MKFPLIQFRSARAGQEGRFGHLAVFLLIAGVYGAYPTENFSWAEDSLVYLANVENGTPNLFPNHLLFEPFLASVVSAARTLGYDGSAMPVFRLVSQTAALAVLLMVVWLVHIRTANTFAATVVALFCAASFGFWHYSSVGETYILPLAFVMLAMCFHERWRRSNAERRTRDLLLMAVAASLAVLFHQMFAMFAVLVFLHLAGEDIRCRPMSLHGSAAIRFGAVAILAVGVPYVLAYAQQPEDLSFFGWAKGHARNGFWDPPSIVSPLKAVVGFATAVVSFNALFAFDMLAGVVEARFPDKILLEEAFLAEQAISRPEAVAAFVLAGIAAGAAAVFLSDLARRPGRACDRALSATGRLTSTHALLFSHVVAYSIFATLWEPLNQEFWINVVIVSAVLVGTRADWSRVRQRVSSAVLVGSLFLVNLVSAIEPLSRRDADYWYSNLAPFLEVAEAGDVLIAECRYICRNYIAAFSDVRLAVPSRADPSRALPLIRGPGQATVYMSSWATDPPVAFRTAGEVEANRRFLAAAGIDRGPPSAGDGDLLVWPIARRQD